MINRLSFVTAKCLSKSWKASDHIARKAILVTDFLQRSNCGGIFYTFSTTKESKNENDGPSEEKTEIELKSEKDKEDLVIRDPSESPTVIKFQKGVDQRFKSNTDSELQLKDNPLALKVMMEGKIDLRDERIKVTSMTLEDSKLLQGADVSGIRQINLGDVSVLPRDSVLLEDIDVYNIPEDKDIVIDKVEKTLFAVGKKMEGRGAMTVHSEKEAESKVQQQDQKFLHQVGKTIFEEKELSEFRDTYLVGLEKGFVEFNYKELLRTLIMGLPFYVLSFCFIQTVLEIYMTKQTEWKVEQQIMNNVKSMRDEKAREIVVSSPIFNRKLYQ